MSKAFGLAGLRVGWLALKDAALRQRCAAFKDYTTICNAAPSEVLALIALRAKAQVLARSQALLSRNLALLDAFFARHPERFSWVRPRAGSVAFPRLLQGSADAFCQRLVEREGVLLLPGSVYDFPGEHFRLGFGRSSMPEALARLERFCAQGPNV
jgi:aspartate/methionine/tyrosine aminotransferase